MPQKIDESMCIDENESVKNKKQKTSEGKEFLEFVMNKEKLKELNEESVLYSNGENLFLFLVLGLVDYKNKLTKISRMRKLV